jgi:hypothetical protein
MTAAENRAIVTRLIEELGIGGNPDLADRFYAADYVRHGPRAEPPIRGRTQLPGVRHRRGGQLRLRRPG